MKKLQIPKVNLRRNHKSQDTTERIRDCSFGFWSLKFLWNLAVGARNFLPRGLALFLGGFSLLNLVGERRARLFDANLWWIDLRVLPPVLANLFLLLCALCLIGFGLRPPRRGWRQLLTTACMAALLIGTGANVVQFYVLLARGVIAPAIPVPLSLCI